MIYSLSVSNLWGDDRGMLLHQPELLRKGNMFHGFSEAVPSYGEWLPDTLVLTNSAAFYDWNQSKAGTIGTLTVETFEPPLKLVIRNCRYDPSQWKTNKEVNRTSGSVFTRVFPATNVTLKAWCESTSTTYSPNGKIVTLEKGYDCRQQ
jgi:hypothetical protein